MEDLQVRGSESGALPDEDFRDRKFQPFYECAIDPVRIELDERIVRDMLGLDEGAATAVAKLRTLLASDPSIHGSKKPELAI